MSRWMPRLAVMLTMLCETKFDASFASAADLKDVVKRVSAATVYIEVGYGSGSGFCVDDAGLIVTNHHVVGDPGSWATIVANSGRGRRERSYRGRVIVSDEEADVAFVSIADEVDEPLTTLELASDGEVDLLQPLDRVIAAGFPFGAGVVGNDREHPQITITDGKVSSVRSTDEDAITGIQTTAVVNPGNSGGPLVDETGQVVGMVTAGNFGLFGSQRRNNFAVSANVIREIGRRPTLSLEAPSCGYLERFDEKEFTLRIGDSPLPRSRPFGKPSDAKLKVTSASREHEVVGTRSADGSSFRFRTAFAHGADESFPVVIRHGGGEATATPRYEYIKPGPIKVGDRILPLSEFAAVRNRNGKPLLVQPDGSGLSGDVTSVDGSPEGWEDVLPDGKWATTIVHVKDPDKGRYALVASVMIDGETYTVEQPRCFLVDCPVFNGSIGGPRIVRADADGKVPLRISFYEGFELRFAAYSGAPPPGVQAGEPLCYVYVKNASRRHVGGRTKFGHFMWLDTKLAHVCARRSEDDPYLVHPTLIVGLDPEQVQLDVTQIYVEDKRREADELVRRRSIDGGTAVRVGREKTKMPRGVLSGYLKSGT